jgi:hypothetical protein
MAGLFVDDTFHIGCDETTAVGPCTVESTFQLERAVLGYVQDVCGKRPAGWEEVEFDAGAATMNTTVFAWARHAPAEIIDSGRYAVNSNASHWYLTEAAPRGPAGWSSFWYDPGAGLSPAELPLLLGAEASQWTDTYCYIDQCGAGGGSARPVGWQLFDPQYDAEFALSIGGMIFPRALVGAGAFYNFNGSVAPDDPAFVAAIFALNDQLAARGGYVCPSNCSCDQVSACGVPYVSVVPVAGAAVSVSECSVPVTGAQRWALRADGTLALASNTSLCVVDDGYNVYPLTLRACGAAATKWTHTPGGGTLVSGDTGNCLDVRESDRAVGTYTCGSGQGLVQANQAWAVDDVDGVIVSLFDGQCLTAAAAA